MGKLGHYDGLVFEAHKGYYYYNPLSFLSFSPCGFLLEEIKINDNKNPLVKYWIKQYYHLKLSNHCSKLFERSKLVTVVLYSFSLLKFIITLQSERNDTLSPRSVFKLEYVNTENNICSTYVQIFSPFLMMYFIFLHVLMGYHHGYQYTGNLKLKRLTKVVDKTNIISLKNLLFL